MITLRGITLRRGTKVVLDQASVTLQPGEKVGLIGRNGAGKSSLFSLLTGRLHADAGDVDMPPRWRIGEVAQDMPDTEDGATDFVLQGDTPLQAAQDALRAAEASGDGHAIGEAHMALDEAGAFDAPARAQALLLGLGFRSDQLDAPVNSFSGGWRMRLQLARALMCPADLLLLDEPTNHLDLDALVWLEAWLKRFDGTLVIISHDREFLDAITRVIVHLDEASLTRYTGNYSAFEEMRAERMMQAQAAFSKQQERMAHLQRFIDRFKAKASQGQAGAKPRQGAGPHGKAGAGADGQRLRVRVPRAGQPAQPDAGAGRPGLRLRQHHHRAQHQPLGAGRPAHRHPGRQRPGQVDAGEDHRACALPPLAGTITEGKGLQIGYFAQQELDVLRLDEGPLSHMVRLARDQGPAGCARAGTARLPRPLPLHRRHGAARRWARLSGGEKARLVLAMLVWQRPNLLLLDEPTNHLDLTTREALSIALNEFEGTVMLVSHDRALLREVCDEFWLVTRGGVEPFDGDLDDYQRWLLEVSRALAKGQPAPPAPRPHGRAAGIAATRVGGTEGCCSCSPSGRATGSNGPSHAKTARPASRPVRACPRPPGRLRVEIQRIDERLARLGAERSRGGGPAGARPGAARRLRRAGSPAGACGRRNRDARRALAAGSVGAGIPAGPELDRARRTSAAPSPWCGHGIARHSIARN